MTLKEYKEKVKSKYGDSIEVLSRNPKGKRYILVRNKYGVLRVRADYLLHTNKKLTISSAINKTSYFMEKLKEKQRELYEMLTPLSEYRNDSTKMLFSTKYGVVAVTPGNLINGKIPSVRTALDRVSYRKNQFLEVHGDKYEYNMVNGTGSEAIIQIKCLAHG